MSTLNKLNCFFVGLPIMLGAIGLIFNDFYFWALVSTMLTGAFQLIAALYLICIEPKNKLLHIYFILVILFFGLWFFNSTIGYENILTITLLGIPIVLTIYLSIIIYKKSKI
jgi:hypothetical protein